MRIVYLGTPEFAVAPLKKLLDAGCSIVGVVTAPDKPAGRGRNIQCSAVKEFALSNDIPLLQPSNLKDTGFLTQLKQWNADLQIVVAFRMLPETVWNMPKLGTINLHASLLPNYRGAAPINWVLINGETQTGVTTFFLEHQIDTGAILLQETVDIGKDENVESLHDRLMEKGANLVLETVNLIESGRYTSIPQAKLIDRELEIKSAPKIFKEDTQINWNNSCKNIYNHIRGLSPYPGAYTTLIVSDSISIVLKIYTSIKRIEDHNYTPGTIISDQKSTLSIACVDGWIDVIELQQQGKKRMGIKAFLAGFNYSEAYCK